MRVRALERCGSRASEGRGARSRPARHALFPLQTRGSGRRPAARRSPRPISRSIDFLRETLLAARPDYRLAVGGDGRRSGAAGAPGALRGRSDRRHARLHRRRRCLVRERGVVAAGRPVVAALNAPARSEVYLATVGRRRLARRHAACGVGPGGDSQGARIAGPRGWLRTEAVRRKRRPCAGAYPLACLSSRPGRGAAGSTRLSRAPGRMTGTLRPPTFWCTKRAVG